jgi:hypothetical protein
MEKLFTVAGTSRRNGTVKFRFSNDMKGRIPMLERTGHTEIQLVELPAAMTKEDAIVYLTQLGFAADDKPAKPARAAQTPKPVQQTVDTVDGPYTADTVRAALQADGEDTEGMSDEFLAEVARRENAAWAERAAQEAMLNEGAPDAEVQSTEEPSTDQQDEPSAEVQSADEQDEPSPEVQSADEQDEQAAA